MDLNVGVNIMRRVGLLLLAFGLLVTTNSKVEAGPISAWNGFWASIHRDTKRNNCWPKPFIYADRASVKAPFVTMVNNGWRMQNMVSYYHFNQETNELTNAGKAKVRWILTQAPQQHRTVFVQTGNTNEISNARIDNVQQLASTIVTNGELPVVQRTTTTPRSWSADQIDSINRAYTKTIPAPRIPAAERGAEE